MSEVESIDYITEGVFRPDTLARVDGQACLVGSCGRQAETAVIQPE